MVSYEEYRKEYLSNPIRRLSAIYSAIKRRCDNPLDKRYSSYGGKGIKNMRDTLDDFCRDMIDSYIDHRNINMKNRKSNTTIDRIDTNGNYCKNNCRWVTHKEQQNNRSNNKVVNGKTIAQWSDESGISQGVIWARIRRNGWTLEEVLSVGPKPRGWNRNHINKAFNK